MASRSFDTSREGKVICTGSDDASLKIWNPKTGESIHTVRAYFMTKHSKQRGRLLTWPPLEPPCSRTIWIVNMQIALTMSHFTWIQKLFIWGSITTWYLFLFAYGLSSPLISCDAFMILVEALAPAPIYWVTTFVVIAACNLPNMAHICF